jgi:hypothetical protein
MLPAGWGLNVALIIAEIPGKLTDGVTELLISDEHVSGRPDVQVPCVLVLSPTSTGEGVFPRYKTESKQRKLEQATPPKDRNSTPYALKVNELGLVVTISIFKSNSPMFIDQPVICA